MLMGGNLFACVVSLSSLFQSRHDSWFVARSLLPILSASAFGYRNSILVVN